jgi:hypothetical protein
MKKNTLIAIACLIGILANAQPTSLADHAVSGVATVSLRYTGSDRTKCEVPPWTIAGGWHTYFMVDGIQTWIFSSPGSIANSSEIDFRNNGVGPYLGGSPYWKDPNFSRTNPVDHWRRTYYNIYSAEYYSHPQAGTISLGFMHSENKNYVDKNDCPDPDDRYQSTINPNVPIDCNYHDTYSGGNPYQDGYLAYHALVTAAWVPNNAQTNWGQQYFNNSLGPIVWPANGYVQSNWVSASQGVGGPSSITVGDYIYIFCGDIGPRGGVPVQEGRGRGIRVLRVHKNDALAASNYKIYYKDPAGNVSWDPSLPAGLTKENMLNYVQTLGPKGTDVLNDVTGRNPCMRFSVAKVKNTNYFIGVEEYIDENDLCSHVHLRYDGSYGPVSKFKVALRFSNDLLNWSNRILIINSPNCWDYHNMRYPILLSADGWSNTEVDLNDFYVLGTGGIEKSVNKVRIYIPPPPPPDPPPPPPIDCPFPDMPCEQPFRHATGSPKELQVEAVVFPNPSSASPKVRFNVPAKARVTIVLNDANGKTLTRVEDRVYERGTYLKEVDLLAKSPGVYLLQVKIGNAMRYLKIVKQ